MKRTSSGGLYEWASICDICHKQRNVGSHVKCSKQRQAERQKKQEAEQQ